MVEQNALREIIEQVLGEMNISGNAAPKPTAAAAAQATTVNTAAATVVEDGFIPDITEVDVRKQYLVENPVNGPAYAELKLHAPCRLAIGKAGSRYKTEAPLQFRAAHSAAQDAVFSGVDNAIIEKMGFFKVDTKCDNKDTFLTRPDLGRQLNEEAVNTLREKCQKNPRVQIYVSDGLSSAAVAANVQDVYPALVQGLKSYGIEVGTPFYLEYGRVGAMDQVSEVTGAEVTCVLIGERPGLITAESMSAYMAYKGTVGMPEARRNVISNIHKDGTPPVEAGAHIAELIKTMLDQKTSGTDLVKA
ncbi:MAG: ethanolamine ammonia-lyase subunit EutC [Synergistaceae bacterium]|nr:ethanolamine ammonia-lyase subunit EutC [Synergistaceae bacterium]